MKLYINSKEINNQYDNLIIKGNFSEDSYLTINHNTEIALINKKIKIYINHIGGAKTIESFKCIIDAEEGDYRINVGGGNPCLCTISAGCKGKFSANMYRGSKVVIGKNTTSNGCEIYCDNSFFVTGIDCMISSEVIFQSSDQHVIVELDNANVINNLKQYGGIAIEDHVWVGRRSTVVGHLNIKSGSIIGIGAIVTSDILSNSVYVGNPAKKIKENVSWCRHQNRFDEYVQQNLKNNN